jgi:hypothetical protein
MIWLAVDARFADKTMRRRESRPTPANPESRAEALAPSRSLRALLEDPFLQFIRSFVFKSGEFVVERKTDIWHCQHFLVTPV